MKFIIKTIYQVFHLVLQLIKPMTHGVRTLLVRDDQVLLVKHIYEDKWFLPGGLVEKGETLEQAVRREAGEEVGAKLNDLALFGVYTNFKNGWYDHITVFISLDFSLNGESDHEIEFVKFYPLDALPVEISEGSKNRINDYLRGEICRFGVW
jgi:ADP-ribose pyrophosphatase YjhB (NUDIX family)